MGRKGVIAAPSNDSDDTPMAALALIWAPSSKIALKETGRGGDIALPIA